MEKLKTILEKFKSCTPDYFSVTYGAGGTSRANTHEMAAHIHHKLDVPAMAHLTCVAHTEKEIDEVLTTLKIKDKNLSLTNNIQNLTKINTQNNGTINNLNIHYYKVKQ